MKSVAPLLLALAACGGQPLLANAPHPNTAAVAGVAAAAAAAITLASPSSAGQKPEQKVNEFTKPIQVNESVPPDVFDRLDQQQAQQGAAPAAPASVKPAATPGRLPTPAEAAGQQQSPADPDPDTRPIQ